MLNHFADELIEWERGLSLILAALRAGSCRVQGGNCQPPQDVSVEISPHGGLSSVQACESAAGTARCTACQQGLSRIGLPERRLSETYGQRSARSGVGGAQQGDIIVQTVPADVAGAQRPPRSS